ncbi:Hpt domain-containing protein [Tardiphaga alba]|uniref:Hpt domain-containing protein n=2 Tax=Tardiphaga alba TaxID=340268 RepID=A0ABX8AFF4_9BRAD|nr:Hpt domain-containing protein [Tardiphaga alba]QUS42503.1 Hpt domain-containing protein [Tardiphaga alba]
MPLHLEWVQWMPSPPLVPDDGPINLDHLNRMTMGDASLEREVLAMFAAQASELIEKIVRMPPNVADLAHKLRGSAEAVGAFRITDAAEWLESALRDNSDSAEALMTLTDAVLEARAEIDGILKRS